eukprot:gene6551-3203_t
MHGTSETRENDSSNRYRAYKRKTPGEGLRRLNSTCRIGPWTKEGKKRQWGGINGKWPLGPTRPRHNEIVPGIDSQDSNLGRLRLSCLIFTMYDPEDPGPSGEMQTSSVPLLSKRPSRSATRRRPGAKSKPRVVERPAVFNSLFRKQQPVASKPEKHSFVYALLSPHSRRWQAVLFKNFVSAVIIVDMLFFIMLLSLAYKTMTEGSKYGKHGALKGRILYLISFSALLDAFATFPFFIELISGAELPSLTFLRVSG